MAKSQANYAIKSIGIVVNTKLKRAYDDKKKVTAAQCLLVVCATLSNNLRPENQQH